MAVATCGCCGRGGDHGVGDVGHRVGAGNLGGVIDAVGAARTGEAGSRARREVCLCRFEAAGRRRLELALGVLEAGRVQPVERRLGGVHDAQGHSPAVRSVGRPGGRDLAAPVGPRSHRLGLQRRILGRAVSGVEAGQGGDGPRRLASGEEGVAVRGGRGQRGRGEVGVGEGVRHRVGAGGRVDLVHVHGEGGVGCVADPVGGLVAGPAGHAGVEGAEGAGRFPPWGGLPSVPGLRRMGALKGR